MVNLAYTILLLFGKLIQAVFFGKLREVEYKVKSNVQIIRKSYDKEHQRPPIKLYITQNTVHWCYDGSQFLRSDCLGFLVFHSRFYEDILSFNPRQIRICNFLISPILISR